MEFGTVKGFREDLGYGFIYVDDNKTEAFVHWRDILSDGYKTLTKGDRVSFNLKATDKGFAAESVYVITED
jgi:CspA family cold shock protein